MHTSKEGADLEKRDGFGGYKVNIIQDETLNDLVNSMGYFPYYRTYEEHFCNPVLSDVFNVTAEEKENHTESQGKQGEGCAVIFRCTDRSLLQSCETKTATIPSMMATIPSVTTTIPSVASVETFDPPLVTDGISENCASEITFLNGLSILNPPFSSTGYFPYYRSEEEQLISPSPWDGSSTAREALEDVSAQSTGRRTSWDFRMRCALS
ncbi:uncharacterized protein LOC132243402 [Alligator mississippiensis]|nr:uncharacterized protein LOC132243402 [Alligator mississippiensis]